MPSKTTEKSTKTAAPSTTKSGKNIFLHPTTISIAGEKAAILDLVQKGEDQHWQMGLHYNNIVDNKLAEAAGYKTAIEFFQKEIKAVSQATLSRYGLVQKNFSEAVATKYGTTKLSALLTYEQVAHTGPVAGDPGKVVIHTRQKDGTVKDVAFADCSVADVEGATHALKGGSAPALSAADQKRVKALQDALATAQGKHGGASVEGKQKGRIATVSIKDLPLDQASAILSALANA